MQQFLVQKPSTLHMRKPCVASIDYRLRRGPQNRYHKTPKTSSCSLSYGGPSMGPERSQTRQGFAGCGTVWGGTAAATLRWPGGGRVCGGHGALQPLSCVCEGFQPKERACAQSDISLVGREPSVLLILVVNSFIPQAWALRFYPTE